MRNFVCIVVQVTPLKCGGWQDFSNGRIVNNEQSKRRSENHRKTIESMEEVCPIKVDAIVSPD